METEIMQSVLDEQLWIRFEALRSSVMEFIKRKVQEGAYHKSYEGKLELSFCFPACFNDPDLTEDPYVNIHLDCSLLVPGGLRHCDWNSSRFDWALMMAEKTIYAWIEEFS